MTYSKHLKGLVTQIDCDAIKFSMDHGAKQDALVEVFTGRRIGNTRASDILEKVLSKEQLFALQGPNSL
jgi:hypothetical protein